MSDVVEGLRAYQQGDADGVMVLVSRQACDEGAAEIETLRTQLAHWKTFAIHAESEHAAWKNTAREVDEELRALRGTAPFTDTRPSATSSSDLRRLATPACASPATTMESRPPERSTTAWRC